MSYRISRFASRRGLWAIGLGAALGCVAGYANPDAPADAAAIRQRMQRVIEFLDSEDYARQTPWDAHIVTVYRLVQARLPTPLELHLLSALRTDIGLSRSAVLSAALRNGDRSPSWSQCRGFVERTAPADFRADLATRRQARRLSETPRWEVLADLARKVELSEPCPSAAAADPMPDPVSGALYQVCFGYLHAHSELSDGTGTPLEAYQYARDQGKLDFFALTDHGEFLMLWPWEDGWQVLIQAAEATYEPGVFVTLWGFEWSNPFLGHINILNTPEFTHCLADFFLTEVYRWLAARPDGFGRFNHPGDYDLFRLEFAHFFRPYAAAVPQMVGIETFNGSTSFDTYYYAGSWSRFSPSSYWDVGNQRGWRLGALGGQDNHSPNWGTQTDFRTAVLAESLTREHIVEAYRQRRFYVTEDKDLHLDVRCDGYPMGSQLSGVTREFVVSAWDGSGDAFQTVRLYRDGLLLESRAVSGTLIQTTFVDAAPAGENYYYVIVTQTDDGDGNGRNDEAISSPIWIE